MARTRVPGIVESGTTRVGPNGFVNRRSSVQSRAPAQGSKYSEEWRPLAGLEEFYEISSRGRVRSLLTGLLAPKTRDAQGRRAVLLKFAGRLHLRPLAPLMAESFPQSAGGALEWVLAAFAAPMRTVRA